MPESADELGAYDPTTPYRPPPAQKAHPRVARTGNKSIAGTSSKSAGSSHGSSRGATAQEEGEHEEHEQIVIGDSEDENEPRRGSNEVMEIPASKTARKTITPRNTANARGGRGKGRGGPPHKGSRSTDAGDDRMEVDEDHPVFEVEEEAPPPPRPRTVGRLPKADVAAQVNEKVTRKLQQTERQLEAVAAERDKLSKQLEELFQIRRTEPEQALEDYISQCDARIKTQETLIHELTSQLANVKALAGSEKSYMLHFLTREAADAEKENVVKEVSRWKEIAKRKDAELAAKDKRIAELQDEEKTLRSELSLEIERTKSLTAKHHSSALPRPGDKQLPVLKLYEDFTNILVLSMRTERSEFLNLNLTEEIYTCVYTLSKPDEDVASPPLSVSFTLRHTWARPDDMDTSKAITSADQLEEKMRYQPIDLDKQEPRFVEALEFFREPFLFSYNQMHVFLKTLTDKITSIQESLEDEDDNEEDVVEFIPTGK